MSEDVLDRVIGPGDETATATLRQSETWRMSYQYLRTAMVALLIGLAVAVFYESALQEFFLASVSAYYYTPAQAIFVGALIGLGACMIALRGSNVVEEVFLNLGGMFAAVVAIVPTARYADFQSAVRACRELADPQTAPDCPGILALAAATRANVENNMFALLVLGLLGLVASVFLAVRGKSRLGTGFWWGFGTALVVWVVALVGLFGFNEQFLDVAHGAAAACLVLCVIVVAIANAVRRDKNVPADDSGLRAGLTAARGAVLRRPAALGRYAWVAWVMLAVAIVGGAAVWFGVVRLFWLEIVVALLFVFFWTAQTLEHSRSTRA